MLIKSSYSPSLTYWILSSEAAVRPVRLEQVFLVFRLDKEVFGSVALEGGPIQFPFAFPCAATAEVESNDSTTTAQPLAGFSAVEGSIPQFNPFPGTGADLSAGTVSMFLSHQRQASGDFCQVFTLEVR
jgi:hypothetical protein